VVSNGLNLPKKISSPEVISRIFPTKFQQIHIISVFRSFHSLHTFKICQTVVGISMISKIHEFFNLIFGGFLQIGPTVRCMAAFEMAVM